MTLMHSHLCAGLCACFPRTRVLFPRALCVSIVSQVPFGKVAFSFLLSSLVAPHNTQGKFNTSLRLLLTGFSFELNSLCHPTLQTPFPLHASHSGGFHIE